MRKALLISTALIVTIIGGCRREANVASHNLRIAAEQFEIPRRTVMMNVINGEELLVITGKCSLDHQGASGYRHDQLEVTCKTESGQYRKHFLGLTDNVTYVTQQLDASNASGSRYRFIVKPSVLLPNIDFE